MNARDDFRPDEVLDEEASAWVCERDEGFTPARAKEFSEWRERDSRHAAALARVEGALALLAEMPVVRASLETRVGRVPPAPVPVAHRGRIVRFRRTVAWMGLAAALVLGTIWWGALNRNAAGTLYATDGAIQRHVALRDGSFVDINVGSAMHVQFRARERHVILDAGEAHFRVAPDATRPFVVTAGGVSVRAVGTAFNVRLIEGEVEVLVTEGKVEVFREQETVPENTVPRPLLQAGERTRVPPRIAIPETAIEKVDTAAIRAALAWQNGVTQFIDVPLREVVERFNRCNTLQFVIEDAELGDRRIGGVIALEHVAAFIQLLEQDGGIVSVPRGPNEIALRRAR